MFFWYLANSWIDLFGDYKTCGGKKGGLFHCRFDKFYVATNPGFMVGSIVVSGSPTS